MCDGSRAVGDDQYPGTAVVHDVLGLIERRVGIHRSEVQPGVDGGKGCLVVAQMVVGVDGDMVTFAQPGAAKEVAEPGGTLVQLAPRVLRARRPHHDREAVGLRARMVCDVHGP